MYLLGVQSSFMMISVIISSLLMMIP